LSNIVFQTNKAITNQYNSCVISDIEDQCPAKYHKRATTKPILRNSKDVKKCLGILCKNTDACAKNSEENTLFVISLSQAKIRLTEICFCSTGLCL